MKLQVLLSLANNSSTSKWSDRTSKTTLVKWDCQRWKIRRQGHPKVLKRRFWMFSWDRLLRITSLQFRIKNRISRKRSFKTRRRTSMRSSVRKPLTLLCKKNHKRSRSRRERAGKVDRVLDIRCLKTTTRPSKKFRNQERPNCRKVRIMATYDIH